MKTLVSERGQVVIPKKIRETVHIEKGDELEIGETEVVNRASGARLPVTPLPKSRQAIVDAGGLIPYTRQRLMAGR